MKADDHPIAPSDIAAAINDLFDRHGPMPMTADMGDCLFTAMEIENTALAAPKYAGMGCTRRASACAPRPASAADPGQTRVNEH